MSKLTNNQLIILKDWAINKVVYFDIPDHIYAHQPDGEGYIKPSGVRFFVNNHVANFELAYDTYSGNQNHLIFKISADALSSIKSDAMTYVYMPIFKWVWDQLNNSK